MYVEGDRQASFTCRRTARRCLSASETRSKRDLLLELTAVGSSEAEFEPAREAPFWQAIQEPTPNSLLPTQKQPNVPEAILTEEAAF